MLLNFICQFWHVYQRSISGGFIRIIPSFIRKKSSILPLTSINFQEWWSLIDRRYKLMWFVNKVHNVMRCSLSWIIKAHLPRAENSYKILCNSNYKWTFLSFSLNLFRIREEDKLLLKFTDSLIFIFIHHRSYVQAGNANWYIIISCFVLSLRLLKMKWSLSCQINYCDRPSFIYF